MSSISSFLRGENFKGKREFLNEFEGMRFIKGVLMERDNLSARLFLKTITLLYDLVINDDNIF